MLTPDSSTLTDHWPLPLGGFNVARQKTRNDGEETARDSEDETLGASHGSGVGTVSAFLTVRFSHARYPSGNRTSSIGMGREADSKFKMADSR
jgi:hypothetical protein